MLAILHTLDPFAIQLSPSFGIRWYGLSYLAGFVAAYAIYVRLARTGRTPLPEQLVSDFVFALALGTIIGGRLGYALFYDPSLFIRFSSGFPFWGLLQVNKGGMASHGGILGIVLACLWFGRRRAVPAPALLDLAALAGGIGIFFGRIANFINGELVGRACSPDLPWAVKFPQDILAWPIEEPARLLTLKPIVEQLGISGSVWVDAAGRNPFGTFIQSGLERIVGAVQVGNQVVSTSLAPLLTARHPSQLYEALLEGAFLFSAMLFLWRRPRHPGTITGWFMILYPLVRIVGEQFRLPDLGIGYQLLGLTRGQWLSVGMLVVGIGALLYFRNQAQNAAKSTV